MEELPDDLHLLRVLSDEIMILSKKSSTLLICLIMRFKRSILSSEKYWVENILCRMFRIWPNQFELGSLRVNPAYRWKKLGYGIMHSLLTEKNLKAEVLACKRALRILQKSLIPWNRYLGWCPRKTHMNKRTGRGAMI